jgi:hypothetical protein
MPGQKTTGAQTAHNTMDYSGAAKMQNAQTDTCSLLNDPVERSRGMGQWTNSVVYGDLLFLERVPEGQSIA